MASAAMRSDEVDSPPKLETAAGAFLFLFVAALQLSIAAAHILLTVALLLWAGNLVAQRERPEVPPMFWPLAAYAGATLVSVAFSRDPRASLVDAREVVLFVIVPFVYGVARGQRAWTVANIIVTVGAAAAVFGIAQYGILEYDNLGQRPRGSMGHYMTYSGLLILVVGLAAARVLFSREDRTWSALVLPALLVALVLTLTRGAWVGACVAIGLLLLLKDLRLIAVAPVLAALFFALAPPRVTDRFYATFDWQDPTSRDRLAMARAGVRMIRDHPLTGVGPDMVKEVYGEYRDPGAVQDENPHLHNVPLHIAAERGLLALAAWLWFVVVVVRGLLKRFMDPEARPLAAAGLAAIAGMLGAGFFEYNFGDSEFLMLLLVLLTLPFAVSSSAGHRKSPAPLAATPRTS